MAESKKSNKTTNSIVVFVIVGVLVGWVAGFLIGTAIANENDNKDIHTASEESHEKSEHSHDEMIEVTNAANAPYVEVNVVKDPKSGYNVQLKTDNFIFSPENASREHVEGEGHAHIYVNGEKLGRVYSTWYHIDSLQDGENEIKVTLNSNSHAQYAVNGQPVQSVVIVTEDGHADHAHVETKTEHSEHSDGDGHSH